MDEQGQLGIGQGWNVMEVFIDVERLDAIARHGPDTATPMTSLEESTDRSAEMVGRLSRPAFILQSGQGRLDRLGGQIVEPGLRKSASQQLGGFGRGLGLASRESPSSK